MQSHEEYERDRVIAHAQTKIPKGIDVACPECGSELLDEGESLISRIPPMKRVTCPECRFSKVVLA